MASGQYAHFVARRGRRGDAAGGPAARWATRGPGARALRGARPRRCPERGAGRGGCALHHLYHPWVSLDLQKVLWGERVGPRRRPLRRAGRGGRSFHRAVHGRGGARASNPRGHECRALSAMLAQSNRGHSPYHPAHPRMCQCMAQGGSTNPQDKCLCHLRHELDAGAGAMWCRA